MISPLLRSCPTFVPKVIHSFCGKVPGAKYIALLLAFFCAGCAGTQPQSPNNICDIFEEKRSWYKAATKTQKRWGVPLQVPMAIMYQESSFRSDARPKRAYFLGLIPWGYESSAYGYSQAKTDTWKDYMRETGNNWADRDDFSDALDFMGWFIDKAHKINKVSKWDAKGLYLNYHEGWGGYKRGTYKRKDWLIGVANKVSSRASRYGAQYRQCKKALNAGWLRRLLS